MVDSDSVCVVTGAGPGNGLAFGRRFVEAGYRVALLSRNPENLAQLQQSLPAARGYPCDVGSRDQVESTFARVREELGAVDVLIHNAGSGVFGSIDEVEADQFEQSWRANALGCFLCVKAVLSDMREAASGNIAIIGATASKRGGARFAAFAPAKAAQYSLAQSLARHLGPQGIHVSYYVVDGAIDTARTRRRIGSQDREGLLKPDDIAQTVLHVVQQAPSAWTFEVDLRPAAEQW